MSTMWRPGTTVLSIWAHPDDETYLAGGVMAAAADAGARVVCVSLTAGERGTDDPLAWPPDRLGPVRRAEHAAAMRILGVTEHDIVGLPDGGLEALGDDAGTDVVADLIDRVHPDTILTFGPDGATFHPDHRAVSRWASAAWRARGSRGRLLHAAVTTEHLARFGALYEQWGVYMTAERPEPVPERELDVHLRLTGAELDRKVAALAAMGSQTAAAIESLGMELFRALNADEMYVGAGVLPPRRASADRARA